MSRKVQKAQTKKKKPWGGKRRGSGRKSPLGVDRVVVRFRSPDVQRFMRVSGVKPVEFKTTTKAHLAAMRICLGVAIEAFESAPQDKVLEQFHQLAAGCHESQQGAVNQYCLSIDKPRVSWIDELSSQLEQSQYKTVKDLILVGCILSGGMKQE
jgi:hypothetical protein